VSVVATLSLAGPGPDARVKISAVPGVSGNVPQLEVEDEFGKLRVEVENMSFHAIPRLSIPAYRSALTTLEGIATTTSVET